MKNKRILTVLLLMSVLLVSIFSGCINKKEDITNVNSDNISVNGRQILVNGQPFIVKGVGYNPVPIGDFPGYKDYLTSQYSGIYSRDLPILREMGANTIRLWGWKNDEDHTDFINKTYNNGKDHIYIILGFWISPDLDLSSPDVRNELKSDFRKMVAKYKYSPAILMWSVGNELNRGKNSQKELDDVFSLVNEMAKEAHLEEGTNHRPVTTSLQDANTIVTIKNYESKMADLDVWSIQLYKGKSFGNFFNDYSNVSSKPLAILEFGIDAYDQKNNSENEDMQAIYAENLWREIENNSNITIGGALTTYSDGWWKSGERQDCEDKDSSSIQSNCGRPMPSFPDKFANDEWWGIMRIKDNGTGIDIVEPRKVYYTLKELWANK